MRTPRAAVVAGRGIASAVLSGYHTCVVTTAGTEKCWGFGRHGRLGNGSAEDRLTATPVTGLSGVTAASNGQGHSCALASRVWCWGNGSTGQLGTGNTADSLVPAPVLGLATGVVQMSTGGQHTCVVMRGGGAKCWGRGRSGQLGNGLSWNSAVPVTVRG